MDPISHVIVGRAVVAVLDRAPQRTAVSAAAMAAVLGALSPDVDFALMPVGWDIYLRVHQAGTHSILGASLVGCAAGLVAAAYARWRVRLPQSLVALATLGALAALSHLILDVLSGAEVVLGWPFAQGRFGLPLVAMADPWLVALLVAGAIYMWRTRRPLAAAALSVLLAAGCLLAAKAILYTQALKVMSAELEPQLAKSAKSAKSARSARLVEARWGAWNEWNVFVRDVTGLRTWRVTAGDPVLVPTLVWHDEHDTALVESSRSLNTFNNFLSVHDLGFAVEDRRESGVVEVRWSDIRYCWQPALAGRPLCALWFGGLFDARGRALEQLVRIGGFSQVRPPPS